MNRLTKKQAVVAISLIFVLTLCAAVVIGCRKKQKEPAPPVKREKPVQTSTADMPSKETTMPAEQAQPAPVVEGNNPQTLPPADSNRQAKAEKSLNKEITQLLKERAKTSQPPPTSTPDVRRPLQEPAAIEPATEEKPPEMRLDQFATLTTAEEKTDWISEFADAHPESVLAMVDMALDDGDAEVRSAAMDALIDKESPDAIEVVAKALKDPDEQIREQALEACEFIEDERLGKILAEALNDESESVRTAALQAADEKDKKIRLEVLKAGIVNTHPDVKESTVSSLIDMSNHAAVDLLLVGLKDPDPEFREEVSSALDFLVGQEFTTYAEAKKWWDANRKRFDDELNERDEQ